MPEIEWDKIDERFFEGGIDRGMISIPTLGVVTPWNGLVSVKVDEIDRAGLASTFDGITYADLLFGGSYRAVVEAYGFPDVAQRALGLAISPIPGLNLTAQRRYPFRFAYRSNVGEGEYKYHFVWYATASSKGRKATTIKEKANAEVFEWVIDAVPPASTEFRPWAHLVIDTRRADQSKTDTLMQFIYGALGTPSIPDQSAIIAYFRS